MRQWHHVLHAVHVRRAFVIYGPLPSQHFVSGFVLVIRAPETVLFSLPETEVSVIEIAYFDHRRLVVFVELSIFVGNPINVSDSIYTPLIVLADVRSGFIYISSLLR